MTVAAGKPAPGAVGTRSRAVIGGLAVLAVWLIAAPYVGPSLGLVVIQRSVVEVVDHVLPGLLALVAVGAALGPAGLTGWRLAAAGLAGVWAAGTHAPLLAQSLTGGVAPAAAVFHSAPGAAMVLLCVTVAVATWPSGGSEAAAAAAQDGGGDGDAAQAR